MIRLKFIVFALSLWDSECLDVYVTKYAYRSSHSDINKDDELFKFLDAENESFVEIQEGPHQSICTYEGEILISIDQTSMTLCKRSKKKHRLEAETVDCPRGQIVDILTEKCQDLQGGGYPQYYIPEGDCPGIAGGLTSHPHEDFKSTYIVCLEEGGAIVADCEEGHYFDKKIEKCDNAESKWTIVTNSICKEASEINCAEEGVFLMNEFFELQQLDVPVSCKNCTYICSLKNTTTFEATIKCFDDITMQRIDDKADYNNYPIFIDNKNYTVEMEIASRSVEPEELTTYPNQAKQKWTIITNSTCKEASEINCKEEGVFLMNEFFELQQLDVPASCKNCTYICSLKNTTTFEATIKCFDDITMERINDKADYNYTIFIDNKNYTVDVEIAGTSIKPQELTTYHMQDLTRYDEEKLGSRQLKRSIRNLDSIGEPASVTELNNFEEFETLNTETHKDIEMETIHLDSVGSEPRPSDPIVTYNGKLDDINSAEKLIEIVTLNKSNPTLEGEKTKALQVSEHSNRTDVNDGSSVNNGWIRDEAIDRVEASEKLIDFDNSNPNFLGNEPSEFSEIITTDDRNSETIIKVADKFNDYSTISSLQPEPQFSDVIFVNDDTTLNHVSTTDKATSKSIDKLADIDPAINEQPDEISSLDEFNSNLTGVTAIQFLLPQYPPSDIIAKNDPHSKNAVDTIQNDDKAYETTTDYMSAVAELNRSNPKFIGDATTEFHTNIANNAQNDDNDYETATKHVSVTIKQEKIPNESSIDTLASDNISIIKVVKNIADDTEIQSRKSEPPLADITVTNDQHTKNILLNDNDHETAEDLLLAIVKLDMSNPSIVGYTAIKSILPESSLSDSTDNTAYETAKDRGPAIVKLEETLRLDKFNTNFADDIAIKPLLLPEPMTKDSSVTDDQHTKLVLTDDNIYETAKDYESAITKLEETTRSDHTTMQSRVSEPSPQEITITDGQHSKNLWPNDSDYETTKGHASAIVKVEETHNFDKSNPSIVGYTGTQSLLPESSLGDTTGWHSDWTDNNAYETAKDHEPAIAKLDETISIDELNPSFTDETAIQPLLPEPSTKDTSAMDDQLPKSALTASNAYETAKYYLSAIAKLEEIKRLEESYPNFSDDIAMQSRVSETPRRDITVRNGQHSKNVWPNDNYYETVRDLVSAIIKLEETRNSNKSNPSIVGYTAIQSQMPKSPSSDTTLTNDRDPNSVWPDNSAYETAKNHGSAIVKLEETVSLDKFNPRFTDDTAIQSLLPEPPTKDSRVTNDQIQKSVLIDDNAYETAKDHVSTTVKLEETLDLEDSYPSISDHTTMQSQVSEPSPKEITITDGQHSKNVWPNDSDYETTKVDASAIIKVEETHNFDKSNPSIVGYTGTQSLLPESSLGDTTGWHSDSTDNNAYETAKDHGSAIAKLDETISIDELNPSFRDETAIQPLLPEPLAKGTSAMDDQLPKSALTASNAYETANNYVSAIAKLEEIKRLEESYSNFSDDIAMQSRVSGTPRRDITVRNGQRSKNVWPNDNYYETIRDLVSAIIKLEEKRNSNKSKPSVVGYTAIQSQMPKSPSTDTTFTNDRDPNSVWPDNSAYETAKNHGSAIVKLEETVSLDKFNPRFTDDTAIQSLLPEPPTKDSRVTNDQIQKSVLIDDNAYETAIDRVSTTVKLEETLGFEESYQSLSDHTTMQSQVSEPSPKEITVTDGQHSKNVWPNDSDYETTKGHASAIVKVEETHNFDKSNPSIVGYTGTQSLLPESSLEDTTFRNDQGWNSDWTDNNAYETAKDHGSAIAKLEETVGLDKFNASFTDDTAIQPLLPGPPTKNTRVTNDQIQKSVLTDDNAYEIAKDHVSTTVKLEETLGLEESYPNFSDDTAIQSRVSEPPPRETTVTDGHHSKNVWPNDSDYETTKGHASAIIKVEETHNFNKSNPSIVGYTAIQSPPTYTTFTNERDSNSVWTDNSGYEPPKDHRSAIAELDENNSIFAGDIAIQSLVIGRTDENIYETAIPDAQLEETVGLNKSSSISTDNFSKKESKPNFDNNNTPVSKPALNAMIVTDVLKTEKKVNTDQNVGNDYETAINYESSFKRTDSFANNDSAMPQVLSIVELEEIDRSDQFQPNFPADAAKQSLASIPDGYGSKSIRTKNNTYGISETHNIHPHAKKFEESATTELDETMRLKEFYPNFTDDPEIQSPVSDLFHRGTTITDGQHSKNVWASDNDYETIKDYVPAIVKQEEIHALDKFNPSIGIEGYTAIQSPPTYTTFTNEQDSNSVWTDNSGYEPAKDHGVAIVELEQTVGLDEFNPNFAGDTATQSLLYEPLSGSITFPDDEHFKRGNTDETVKDHLSAIAKLSEPNSIFAGDNDENIYETATPHVQLDEIDEKESKQNFADNTPASKPALNDMIVTNDLKTKKEINPDRNVDNDYETAINHELSFKRTDSFADNNPTVPQVLSIAELEAIDRSDHIPDEYSSKSIRTKTNTYGISEAHNMHPSAKKLEESASFDETVSTSIDNESAVLLRASEPSELTTEDGHEVYEAAINQRLAIEEVAGLSESNLYSATDKETKTVRTESKTYQTAATHSVKPAINRIKADDDSTIPPAKAKAKAPKKLEETNTLQQGFDNINGTRKLSSTVIDDATTVVGEINPTILTLQTNQIYDAGSGFLGTSTIFSQTPTVINSNYNKSETSKDTTTTPEHSDSAETLIDSLKSEDHKITALASETVLRPSKQTSSFITEGSPESNNSNIHDISVKTDHNIAKKINLEVIHQSTATQPEANHMGLLNSKNEDINNHPHQSEVDSSDHIVTEPPSSHNYSSLVAASKEDTLSKQVSLDAIFGQPNSYMKAANSFTGANPKRLLVNQRPNPTFSTTIQSSRPLANALIEPAESVMLAGSSKESTITSRGELTESDIAIASYLPLTELHESEDYRTFPESPCPSEGLFRYKNSCTDYYQCTRNNACGKLMAGPIMKCPRCFKFNAQKKRCDLPQNVPECTYLNSAAGFYYTKYKQRRYCTGEGKFVVPENCKYYYECTKWRGNMYALSVKVCPGGKRFNDQTKQCERNFVCPNNISCCTKDGTAYDKYSCERFYRCDYQRFPFYCPYGYVFSGRSCVSG